MGASLLAVAKSIYYSYKLKKYIVPRKSTLLRDLTIQD